MIPPNIGSHRSQSRLLIKTVMYKTSVYFFGVSALKWLPFLFIATLL